MYFRVGLREIYLAVTSPTLQITEQYILAISPPASWARTWVLRVVPITNWDADLQARQCFDESFLFRGDLEISDTSSSKTYCHIDNADVV